MIKTTNRAKIEAAHREAENRLQALIDSRIANVNGARAYGPDAARNAFRQYLGRIRRAVGDVRRLGSALTADAKGQAHVAYLIERGYF